MFVVGEKVLFPIFGNKIFCQDEKDINNLSTELRDKITYFPAIIEMVDFEDQRFDLFIKFESMLGWLDTCGHAFDTTWQLCWISSKLVKKIYSQTSGLNCLGCRELFPMAVPTLSTGELACWSCRNLYYIDRFKNLVLPEFIK